MQVVLFILKMYSEWDIHLENKMNEKIRNGIMMGLFVFLEGLLIFREEWVAVILSVVLAVICYCKEKKEKEKVFEEFADISEMLEILLQKKTFSYTSTGKDTLFEKIVTQIQRLDEISSGNQKMLEKEREDTKQLLAEISHQLRTPLANMETYLALLEEEEITNEEKRVYVKSVENAEEKIKFLVEKFMLAARMENKIIQIHKYNMNLKETVAEAVFQVYKKAEKKNIYIEIEEKTDRENKCVPHDKNWICESIYNLLDNSIKYSPKNSKIIVSIKDNEMFSEISVEDEGIGIDPEDSNKIFHLYYRGENATKQDGFGMGLFITREIVKKHEGFIRVRPKEKGLIISIFLPKAGT